MFAFNRYFFAAAKWLVLAVSAVASFAVHAQTDKPCKAQVRANRNKTLVFERLETGSLEWEFGDGIHINRTGDSVHVQKNGVTLTRFKIRGGQLAGTRYEEFYPNGKLKRMDSLSREGWVYGHEENYFRLAHAFVVSTRTYHPDGLPETIRHYRRYNGKDSLRKTWHPNGALQQTVWAYHSGSDSAVWHWNPDGILSGIRYGGHRLEFYPTGILKSSSVDTVIAHQPLTCSKTYHPNGTLRSVEYESEGIPYLTWLYYTEEGILAKRIPHAPPKTHESWGSAMVMSEEPTGAFVYIEQLPEFPGGEPNLKKYLNEKLASVACESLFPLPNSYKVWFTVNTDGVARFQSIQGENAEGIHDAIRLCINAMPRWKPGRMAGQWVNATYGLVLGLEHRPNGKRQ